MSEKNSFEEKVQVDPILERANHQVNAMLKREIIRNTQKHSENMLTFISGLEAQGLDSYRIVEQIKQVLTHFVNSFAERFNEETKNIDTSLAQSIDELKKMKK